MTAVQAALLLLAITALGAGGMIAWVVERKLRRDRREEVSSSARARIREAICCGDVVVLRGEAERACEKPAAQVDFAVAASGIVDRLDSSARAALHDVALGIGLTHSMLAQLTSSNPIERGRAAFLLGELRLPESEGALAGLLADPDPDVRLVACAELGGIATVAAADSLIAALMNGALPCERLIERLAGDWAVPAMIAVLEDDERALSLAPADGNPAPGWRAAVARALGVAGDPRAELVLARMLDRDHVEERVAAARALGPSGSSASIPALIRALDDSAWEVRAQAAKSLAAHPEESAIPALEERLSDQAWWVRSNAADSLTSFGPDGVEALQRALSHPDRYARERAGESLALHQLAGV